MAKKNSKAKKSKRDNDLFAQLQASGVRKSVADQLARTSSGLESGKKKAEQGVREAAENFRRLAADLEAKLPGDTDVVPSKPMTKPPANRRTTARKPAARKPAAKKPATRKPAARTAASRSAAAKKAAATRKANAAKRAAGN